MYYTYAHTPAGELLLTNDGVHMTGVHWTSFARAPKPDATWIEQPELFTKLLHEIDEYFAGKRSSFNTSFQAAGTPFQKAVWAELATIPYGKTTTYQAIATAIGKPKAVRAVGTAIGSNPVCVIVPCHRVITSSGTSGGYAGGIEAKKLLLQLESTES